MPLTKLRPTFTLTEDRLRELQSILPEAFVNLYFFQSRQFNRCEEFIRRVYEGGAV